MIRSVADLKVHEKAYKLAMEIFELTKAFPKEEVYSLTDQIRRSARSVAINIREGFAKRRYEQLFIRHLNDSLGSCEETRGWLRFAVECGYVTRNEFEKLNEAYDEVSAMLYSLMKNWQSHRVSEEVCGYSSSLPTEDRRQKAEGRRQKTEGRRQRTEDRGQKAELTHHQVSDF